MSERQGKFGIVDDYPPLPAGRHPLSRQFVEEYQRRRFVVAVAEAAHESGLSGVTVSGLCTRARISRKTFYEYFENRRECIECASEVAAEYLFGALEAALDGEGPAARGEERVDAGVAALLGAVAREPNLAELALIHGPALGGARSDAVQEAGVKAIAGLVEGADPGRRLARPGAETIAIAILGVIAHWIRRGETDRIDALAEEVVQLARLASLGVDP